MRRRLQRLRRARPRSRKERELNWDHLQLPASVAAELDTLAEQYGEPLVCAVPMGSRSGQFGPRIRERTLKTEGMFAPIGKPDRYGEVCMVVRRHDGRLITARKAYYPPNTFRLLTGGINHGESVADALLREVHEETGLTVEVQRFLAAASYYPADQSVAPFHTFAFLVDEVSGTLGALDPDEEVAEYHLATPAELPELAARLASLGSSYHSKIEGLWHDWGQFRAVIHELVAEVL